MPLNWIIVNKFGLEKWGEVAFLQKASSSLIPKYDKNTFAQKYAFCQRCRLKKFSSKILQ